MSGWTVTVETVYRIPHWAKTEDEALDALEEGWGRCVDQSHTVERDWEFGATAEEEEQ